MALGVACGGACGRGCAPVFHQPKHNPEERRAGTRADKSKRADGPCESAPLANSSCANGANHVADSKRRISQEIGRSSMKRNMSAVLAVLLAVLLMGAAAHAQGVSLNPQDPNAQQRLQEVQDLVKSLTQAAGQRSGGGRGAPATGSRGAANWLNGSETSGSAWWTNAALVQQLGLTDDQKAKIERAFENHRQQITSTTQLLEKEEAQLGRLLAAEPLDRNAVLTQIDHVIQARGEVERANSAMTLEMREYLTRAQW